MYAGIRGRVGRSSIVYCSLCVMVAAKIHNANEQNFAFFAFAGEYSLAAFSAFYAA
jgi:hypothetical protein